MMFFELGWSGQSETSRFQGLSGGNTSRAETMASASAVSNGTGLSDFGLFAARTRFKRAGSPWTTDFSSPQTRIEFKTIKRIANPDAKLDDMADSWLLLKPTRCFAPAGVKRARNDKSACDSQGFFAGGQGPSVK